MKLLFVGDWAPVALRREKIGEGIAIANLECAFADGEVASEKAYSSVLPRSCMDNIPSGGFAALSVANNHVNDAANFRETYAELIRLFPSIQFFGTSDKPYAVFESNNLESNNQTIVIGCLEPCRSRGDYLFKQEDVTALIRKLRSASFAGNQTIKQSANQTILIYPHWGMEGEYTRYPSPAQLKLAHKWIDAGADGVIGNHSHVPQGKELYKGKPIYYSLGNFDFPLGETKAVPESFERMVVRCDAGCWSEEYDSPRTGAAVAAVSAIISDGWTIWKWARTIGRFNIEKNTASWRLRLKRNFLKTFPKYVVWQFLPKIILFRIASLWLCCKK